MKDFRTKSVEVKKYVFFISPEHAIKIGAQAWIARILKSGLTLILDYSWTKPGLYVRFLHSAQCNKIILSPGLVQDSNWSAFQNMGQYNQINESNANWNSFYHTLKRDRSPQKEKNVERNADVFVPTKYDQCVLPSMNHDITSMSPLFLQDKNKRLIKDRYKEPTGHILCVRSHQNDAHVTSYMCLIWWSWNNLRNAYNANTILHFLKYIVYQFTRLFHSLIFKWIKLHHYWVPCSEDINGHTSMCIILMWLDTWDNETRRRKRETYQHPAPCNMQQSYCYPGAGSTTLQSPGSSASSPIRPLGSPEFCW